MNVCERQWVLVVVVWLSLLTLFTANGYPFREQDVGFGINDDPAENQQRSLSERDVPTQEGTVLAGAAHSVGNASTNASSNTTNNSTGNNNNTTESSQLFNNSNITDAQNKTNLTTTASRTECINY